MFLVTNENMGLCLCILLHVPCFLENEQQIIGKGNEGESQNPHQTLVIINIDKPMVCHSLQC